MNTAPITDLLTRAILCTHTFYPAIALFILLIACINFVNLTVARSIKRAKEIGIRKVVGGGKKQLMIQFMSESFVLCLGAFLMAIVIVQIILPTFNHLANKALHLSYLLDLKLIAGYLTLFIATGLLAGFYPAVVLSGYSPVSNTLQSFYDSRKELLTKRIGRTPICARNIIDRSNHHDLFTIQISNC